ncbi:hypothetical protein BDF21DRAFT_492461, partial [Thamnidium elegans]
IVSSHKTFLLSLYRSPFFIVVISSLFFNFNNFKNVNGYKSISSILWCFSRWCRRFLRLGNVQN